MNGLLVLAMLGATLQPHCVKQTLADTVSRMDSGARRNNETSVGTIESHLLAPIVDNRNESTTRVNKTAHVKSKNEVEDILDCGKQRKCSGKCHAPVQNGADQECYCDILCWFYGDCCLDYYEDCLQVSMNDTDHAIMLATLSNLGTFRRARILRRVLKLVKLSACMKAPYHFDYMHLVRECGADPETEMIFDALHQKLTTILPGQDINVFAGISKEEIITKCRGSSERLTKDRNNLETIPVTMIADLYQVDFYNVFCAICNGVDPAELKYWESKISCFGENKTTEYAIGAILNVSDASTDHCDAKTTIPKTSRLCVDSFAHFASGAMHHYSEKCTLASTETENELFPTQNNTTNKLFNASGDDSTELQENPASDDAPNSIGPNRKASLDDCGKKPHSIGNRKELLAQLEPTRFCQMYIYSFYWKNKWYKNPHCLPCLSTQDRQNKSSSFWDSFECPKSKCFCKADSNVRITDPQKELEIVLRDIFTASFRVLFDFRRHKIMVVVNDNYLNLAVKSCRENQTYVPHYQDCHEIVCPLGKHLVGSTCVAYGGCGSGQGGNENTCGENMSGRSFQERLSLVGTTRRLTIIMKFRYILNIQSHVDSNEALIDDSSLDGGSTDVPRKSDQGHNGSTQSSGDETTNITSSIDKFSIVDINTLRSLWGEASGMNGINDIGEAVIRLSAKVKENMLSLINRSGGISPMFHYPSDFGIYQSNSVSMSIVSDFDETDSLSFLLARLAHWGVNENLTRLANENAFMFYQIEISSETISTPSSLSTSEIRPCNIWEVLTYHTFKVYVDENGSHAFRFKNRSTTLSETMFNVTVDLNDGDDEVGISTADVGVCQQHVETTNCSYVYFNRSDFVIYQDSLVTTKRARDLAHFLGTLSDYEKRASSLADFVGRFEQQYGKSDILIHRSEQFIMADDGAFVCQNYSRNYSLKSMGNSTLIYYIMPTSFSEQVATVASLALSIVCLTIVLIIYGLVKELRNIPGKIVMSMSGTLLLAQIIFLFSTYPRGVACQIYAAVQHAMWLASFAWLAVMAIHLAYVLYFQSHATSASSFLVFSCLCWALPFFLVGCLFVLDVTGLLNIQYGTNGICWIGNTRAMAYAFGVPLFTMLFATLVCAVFVVRAIRKSTKFRHNNTLNHSGEKTQLLLCVNLSLLMGFNWVFYFLALASDTTAMWTVFIVTNGSQGCYIFLCYVARRAILAKVIKQLNTCQGAVAKSRNAQGSPTVSHRVTKTTTLSPATSLKNLHLVANPRSSPSNSPVTSPSRFDHVIAL